MSLTVGSVAPDFSLTNIDREKKSLSALKGKKVVLVFLPGAFTGVCTKEVCSFQSSLAAYSQLNAEVLAITVDSHFANKAWADANGIKYPVLSDYSRETISNYGGLHFDFAGMSGYSAAKRSVFVVNEEGIISYAWVSENPGVEPPYEEIKNALL
ncbi:MAG: redoxin domain-containing protein [Bacteroidota bacterium]